MTKALFFISDTYFKGPLKSEFLKYFPKNVDVKVNIVKIGKIKNDFLKIIPVTIATIKAIPLINKYDFIVSMSVINSVFLVFLQKIFGEKFFKFKHIVIDVGTTFYVGGTHKVVLSLLRFFYSSVYKILCYAKSSVEFWQSIIGVRNTEFVHLFTNTDFFVKQENINVQEYIFSAGREGRDFSSLLDAVEGLGVKLIIVSDQKNYKKIRHKLQKMNNVEFYQEVDFDTYTKFLSNAKLVVLPLENTKYHPGQTVLIQAMAASKAVIATKSNGTIDYIDDGVDGFFVDFYDVKGIREKILFLLNNEEQRKIIEQNARIKALSKFSEKNFVNVLERIFNEKK